MSARPAQSLYAGLRVTVTRSPVQDGPLWVTVAIKQVTGRWDEWSLLFPAVKVRGPDASIDGWLEVLEYVIQELEATSEYLG